MSSGVRSISSEITKVARHHHRRNSCTQLEDVSASDVCNLEAQPLDDDDDGSLALVNEDLELTVDALPPGTQVHVTPLQARETERIRPHIRPSLVLTDAIRFIRVVLDILEIFIIYKI